MYVRFNLWLLVLLVLLLIAGQASAQSTGAIRLAVFKGPVTPILAE